MVMPWSESIDSPRKLARNLVLSAGIFALLNSRGVSRRTLRPARRVTLAVLGVVAVTVGVLGLVLVVFTAALILVMCHSAARSTRTRGHRW
jgi:hypothetical protein